jgi:hypothetical protein
MSENNPLLAFSLAGEGGALTEKAIKKEPLLGELCFKGECTVYYAPPMTGKTLITLAQMTDAVNEGRIVPQDIFYINADDSQAGYAEKVKILDDFGIHTLVPGEKGFFLSALVPALLKLADNGEASGKLVVVDTVKKIADLMDKRSMRQFGIAIRPFTMAGGTLLLLAHTNKARGAKGELIYAGTSDLLEDVDCAYMIDEATEHPVKDKKLVRFTNLKRRGPNVDRVLYQYDVSSELAYSDRVLSVELADPEYSDSMFPNSTSSADIKQALAFTIRHGSNPAKMAIVKSVSNQTKTSRRKVQEILDLHTDEDPAVGLWFFEVRARGAHLYRLHPAGLALTNDPAEQAT